DRSAAAGVEHRAGRDRRRERQSRSLRRSAALVGALSNAYIGWASRAHAWLAHCSWMSSMTAKPLESISRGAAAPAGRETVSRPTLVASSRPLPADHVERNPGMPLDLDVVRGIRVNRSAVERRAATIPTRRTVKKEWQAAWLLRAITLIDLTTLSGDDTPGNVRRLCAKARHPLRDDIAQSLGGHHLGT